LDKEKKTKEISTIDLLQYASGIESTGPILKYTELFTPKVKIKKRKRIKLAPADSKKTTSTTSDLNTLNWEDNIIWGTVTDTEENKQNFKDNEK